MLEVKRVVGAKINTKDMEKMISHYTEVLGMHLVEKGDNGNAYISTGVDHHNVILTPSSESGLNTLLFEIGTQYSLIELKQFFDQNQIKAEIKSDAELGLPEVLEIVDPDNFKIYLFSETKKISLGFGGRGILPNKVGHVALAVKDVQKTVSFYEQFLGFKVSDWMADFFCFMRCTSDHHNMNFLESKKGSRMHHIAFELKDASHLINSCDLLARHQKPLIWGPVRHGIGHNISIYYHDEENNIIELFTELDTVNEATGYFDPRPTHQEFPQGPRVWEHVQQAANLWGTMPPDGFME